MTAENPQIALMEKTVIVVIETETKKSKTAREEDLAETLAEGISHWTILRDDFTTSLSSIVEDLPQGCLI